MRSALTCLVLGIILATGCSSKPDPKTELLVDPPPPPPENPHVVGTYRNPALGYSINVPAGRFGITGEEAGPERGLRIPLQSGGQIVIYGEPNSFELKNPSDGVRQAFAASKCPSVAPKLSRIRIGGVSGVKGKQTCGDVVADLILVFRPNGGPLYWILLRTRAEHAPEDEAMLQEVVRSFKFVKWE